MKDMDRAVGQAKTAGQASLLDSLLAEFRKRVSSDAKVCVDASQDDGQAWQFLLSSAQRGNKRAMVLFATSAVVRAGNGPGKWDLEALAAYREYAFRFLTSGAESGDPLAIERLGVELMTPGVGTRAIPYDPVRGLAYLQALASHSAGEYRAHLSEIIRFAKERSALSASDISAADFLSQTIVPINAFPSEPLVDRPAVDPTNEYGCPQG